MIKQLSVFFVSFSGNIRKQGKVCRKVLMLYLQDILLNGEREYSGSVNEKSNEFYRNWKGRPLS